MSIEVTLDIDCARRDRIREDDSSSTIFAVGSSSEKVEVYCSEP